MTNKYTTTQYAKILGVSREWVTKLCNTGKINTDKVHAEKVGSVWIIEVEE